ncbi:MAG TPA: molybdopterin molybdotransferase MoeA [Methanosarcinales archaeon]|nr:molybdopterin molybdotransferase MoeA [Methanosarcinales archaeon]
MVFRKRTPPGLAKEMFLEHITPIERREEIAIEDAVGRILADDIVSEIDVPDHRRSAMDGYAVFAHDTTGASEASPVLLQEGIDCVRVHTGSPVPDRMDAVVVIEDTLPAGDGVDERVVEVHSAVHPNKNISLIGEDVSRGDRVFTMGHQVRACDVAMLAMLGITDVQVFARPRVAIIPTGSELAPRAGIIEDGKIRETNGLMVGLYVEEWGGVPDYRGIVIDDPDLIEKEILTSVDGGADMIILCGGTSVGARDYVPGAIDSLGDLLVHGVALSPGKPAALGMIGQTPVLSLPGYPVACLIASIEFARPAILKLGRVPEKPERLVRARLGSKIASRIGYLTYTRVALEDGVAHPVMTSGAGILSSVTRSDGFVIIKEELEGLDCGDLVDVSGSSKIVRGHGIEARGTSLFDVPSPMTLP